MTRMDDLGEEFTIKFVNDFCNVERSVGDTATKGLSSTIRIQITMRVQEFSREF